MFENESVRLNISNLILFEAKKALLVFSHLRSRANLHIQNWPSPVFDTRYSSRVHLHALSS